MSSSSSFFSFFDAISIDRTDLKLPSKSISTNAAATPYAQAISTAITSSINGGATAEAETGALSAACPSAFNMFSFLPNLNMECSQASVEEFSFADDEFCMNAPAVKKQTSNISSAMDIEVSEFSLRCSEFTFEMPSKTLALPQSVEISDFSL